MSYLRNNLRNVPKGLIIFIVFAGTVSLIAVYYLKLASDDFRAAIVPHVGWTGLFFYLYLFFISIFLLIKPNDKLRKGIMYFFMLPIVFGAISVYTHIGRDNYDNPYLTYGMFRPIWDFVIPIIWVKVLSSKSIKDYCNVSI